MTTLNIPIDAAAARLRSAGHAVEKQGSLWRVRPPGGDFAITSADEVRALALGLPEQGTPTQAEQAPAVLSEVVLMGQAEARQAVEQIKTHLDSARRILLDLYEREGWRALGYATWRDCAVAEFGQSTATLYRQLEAAEIERDISQVEKSGIPIPTTQLQPLKALPPEQRPEAWQRAGDLAGNGKRTAAHVQQAVAEIKPPSAEPTPTIPPDIAAAARNLALTIEARGDRLLLYWPDEADDLDQMDPLTPDLAREWLQTEAGSAAQHRAEALGWDQRVSSDASRAWYRLTTDGRETAAYADAALAAGDALRIAYGETAPPILPPEAEPTTTTTIRRGDRVQLPDGATTTVIGTPGGYIVTPAGTYGPWQLSPPPPDAPLDPRTSATAFAAKTRRTMDGSPDSVSFRKSEMAAAVAHIDALLALLSAPTSDSADVWGVLGDLLLSDERARLLACRGALDAIVEETAIDTDAYDALSRRVGDAEQALVEQEQAA